MLCVLVLLPSSVIKLAGVREKKATSAPEISAEHNSSTNKKKLKYWVNPKVAKNKSKLGGSESKCDSFS